MAATNSFKFSKGEDVQIDWTIRTGPTASFPVVNITGWAFSFKVKLKDSDPDPSLVTPTIVITDALNGGVRTTITSADLQALDGDYRHSFWRTNSGSKARLSKGFFSVTDTVES